MQAIIVVEKLDVVARCQGNATGGAAGFPEPGLVVLVNDGKIGLGPEGLHQFLHLITAAIVANHQLQRSIGLAQDAVQRLLQVHPLVGRHDDADQGVGFVEIRHSH
ncbi:hypothetical protein D3C81_1820770 [compost metagenome]